MKSEKKKCQAYAESSKGRCQKNSLPGSRYCFWHQSWGQNIIAIVASIILLVIGILFSPLAGDFYRKFIPSDEMSEIQSLGKKVANSDIKLSKQLTELLAQQGNEKAKEEYLDAYQQIIQLYANKITNQSDSESDEAILKKQRGSRLKIEQLSKELAAQCELRWKPALDFILGIFDAEIKKYQENGYISTIESLNLPTVVSEKQYERHSARIYKFIDDSTIAIQQEYGRVKSGKLVHKFEIDILFYRPNYPREYLLHFNFYKDKTNIHSEYEEIGVQNLSTKLKPMDDGDFLEIVPIAIKKVVNYSIVHSDVDLKGN